MEVEIQTKGSIHSQNKMSSHILVTITAQYNHAACFSTTQLRLQKIVLLQIQVFPFMHLQLFAKQIMQ